MGTRENAHPMVRWAVAEMARANGTDPDVLWDWIERKRKIPHETATSIEQVSGGQVRLDDFDVEMPPLWGGLPGPTAPATVVRPPAPVLSRSPGHRGPPTEGRNPEFAAWVVERFGSVTAAAKHYGIQRSTLAAWAAGRNTCPGLWRSRFFTDSRGAVPVESWDRALEAFKRDQRTAA